MAVSFYFNKSHTGEQRLIEDLVTESIRHYGIDLHYLPKTRVALDEIYGEDDVSEYNKAYLIDMYVKNVEGFAGEGDFLSKFGLQIRDRMTLTVSRRTFSDEIGMLDPNLIRPREGDLIFFPLNNKLFQITFVEHEPVFYQLGALQMYDIVVELFEYSGERFNTGIETIDFIERNHSLNMVTSSLLTSTGLFITDSDGFPIILSSYNEDTMDGDAFSDSTEIETESDSYIDFSESSPFGEP